MENITIKEEPIDDVLWLHLKEEPAEHDVGFPAAATVKEELDIGPKVLQRVHYNSMPCKPEPGEEQLSETCTLEQQHADRRRASDSSTPKSNLKKPLSELSSKLTSPNKKEPPEDNVRSPGAATLVKEEVEIRSAVPHRVYYNKNRRQASDSSNPKSHLKQELLSELSSKLASTNQKEPPEDKIHSPGAATVVKEDMDIGPTELQRVDRYYSLPCNPEPGEEQASGSLSLKKQGKNDVVRRELTESSTLITCANTNSSPHYSICNKSVTKPCYFKLHVSLRTGRTFYSCNICNKRFFQKSYVINHLLDHAEKKPHTCSICSKSFKAFSQLKVHMIAHSVQKPHSCNICSNNYKSVSQLNVHMCVHSAQRPHSCNKCSKSFKTKSHLKQHTLIHLIEKLHSCNICNKSFKIVSQLKLHMIVHSVQKPHSCNICSKSFKTARQLKVHTIVHSVQKPYSCNICSKSFKSTRELKQHMVVHSVQKPHSCNMCSKSYKRKQELRLHMVVHTEQKPHSCNICSKSFYTVYQFKKHMSGHT